VRAKKKLIAVDSDANPIRKSELAARVESRSGHHMDGSRTLRVSESQAAGDTSPERQCVVLQTVLLLRRMRNEYIGKANAS
jgi:hypothetical protein